MFLLDRYLSKKVIVKTAAATMFLCVFFILGTIFKKAEVLFVQKNLPTTLLLEFLVGILPSTLIFILPWSFLIAVLLTFSQLSSQKELLIMRLTGRSLFRIASPIFVIGILLCLANYYLAAHISPKTKKQQKTFLIRAIQQNPNSFLSSNNPLRKINNQLVYLQKIRHGNIQGLSVFEMRNDGTTGFPSQIIYAQSSALKLTPNNNKLYLKNKKVTFLSLAQQQKRLLQLHSQEPLIFDFKQNKLRITKPNSLTNLEINAELASLQNQHTPKATQRKNKLNHEIKQRLAFSFACLGFCFIGIPLGIQTQRKESSKGFFLSIVIAFIYYFIQIFSKEFHNSAPALATVLLWLPNILSITIGYWLLRRLTLR